ncbi:hypothetical protein [Inediibacterium massiliense]|uniref:hypothetical protein n=1 Tax=Inediibacterium massiliense TaxID=1658111 RepID=UPI0006B408DF|nr:hypothetical protein [Inediibacterium massiliense]
MKKWILTHKTISFCIVIILICVVFVANELTSLSKNLHDEFNEAYGEYLDYEQKTLLGVHVNNTNNGLIMMMMQNKYPTDELQEKKFLENTRKFLNEIAGYRNDNKEFKTIELMCGLHMFGEEDGKMFCSTKIDVSSLKKIDWNKISDNEFKKIINYKRYEK